MKKNILRKIVMLLVGILVLFGSFPFRATAEDDLIEVTYLDGEEKVTRTVREVQENMDTGWYAVTDEGFRYDDAIVVIGDVNLILCDHTNTFAANGVYITEGSTYRIPTTGIE